MTIQLFGNIEKEAVFLLTSTENHVYFSTNKTCLGYTGSSVSHALSISGTLKLTKFDPINTIASGIFDCIIAIPDCDALKITDGVSIFAITNFKIKLV